MPALLTPEEVILEDPVHLPPDWKELKVVACKPAKKKEIFSVRHPKIYRKWRRCRRLCQAGLPVAQFAGSVAQFIMLF